MATTAATAMTAIGSALTAHALTKAWAGAVVAIAIEAVVKFK